MIERPVHNSLARWRPGITAAALAAAAGSAGGSAARAGGGRGSGEAHVCFPFSCIIYFASACGPAARADAPSQRLSPLPLRGRRDGRGELLNPRAQGSRAAPPRRAGTRGGHSLPARGSSEETFPAPVSASAACPGPGRGVPPLPPRARPGAAWSHRALHPVRARSAWDPSSTAPEAQAARKLLLQCPVLLPGT